MIGRYTVLASGLRQDLAELEVVVAMDQSVPAGSDWHRELLRQKAVEIPGMRPPVLTAEVANDIHEFLRFRHVVRHVYAFALEPDQIEQLALRLRPTFRQTNEALLEFAAYLENLARAD